MKIRVIDLKKYYGNVKAVDGINFEVNDGEIFGLIGPSGCGKSTLLKVISGILPPDYGKIYFDDEDVTDLPLEQRNIGFVFQDVRLFNHLTIEENIGYAPILKGMPESDKLVKWLIGFIKARVRKKDLPKNLSRGMQQKISLARAIAGEPKIFLFDEPLAGLDARIKVEMIFELRNLIKDLGITSIYVTHDQWEILSIADRIAVMKSGKIVQIGTPEELYYKPKNEFVSEFIGGETNISKAIYKSGQLKIAGISIPVTGLKDGSTYLVSVRPEAFIPGNKYEAPIEDMQFLGAFTRITIRVDNLKFVVRFPSRFLKRYDVLNFNIDPNKIIILKR